MVKVFTQLILHITYLIILMSLKCPIQIPPEVKIMCIGGKYIIACSTELLFSKLLIIPCPPPPPQLLLYL